MDVSLVRPQNEETRRIKWTRYYDASGHCMVIDHQQPIPACSNHLKLTFAFESAEQRQARQTQNVVVANAIRLVFGVSAARELILTSHFSDQSIEGNTFSEVGYASPFDNQNVNRFDNPPIEGAKLNRLPEEAAILLDKAFDQRYPHERFVLMWLALEAIINSHPGGGKNGAKRERFFRDELKSEAANAEVFRLFTLRGEVFKEGKFRNTRFDEESWSLYSALQLAVMKDGAQRDAFLRGYEAYLADRLR